MIGKQCTNKNHEGNKVISITLFGKLRSSSDGYRHYCKKCTSRNARAYAIKNKDTVKKSKQKYYAENKDKYTPIIEDYIHEVPDP